MNQDESSTLTAQRRATIQQMLADSGTVRVADLAERFAVDPTTIRRDLTTLEDQGILQRVHGGAIATAETAPTQPGPALHPALDPQEQRIGRTVAEMIADGETLFLGPGRLPLAVAQALDGHEELTIVTNGLAIAHWISTHLPHSVIVTGGQVQGRQLGLSGPLAKEALPNLRATRVILELGGVNAIDGLTDDSLTQAEIALASMEIGSEIIVLVPADRVGRVAAAHVCDGSDIDVVVTAREAPSPPLWDLAELGVRIVLA